MYAVHISEVLWTYQNIDQSSRRCALANEIIGAKVLFFYDLFYPLFGVRRSEMQGPNHKISSGGSMSKSVNYTSTEFLKACSNHKKIYANQKSAKCVSWKHSQAKFWNKPCKTNLQLHSHECPLEDCPHK